MVAGAYMTSHPNAATSDVEEGIADFLRHAPHRTGGDKYKVGLFNLEIIYKHISRNLPIHHSLNLVCNV